MERQVQSFVGGRGVDVGRGGMGVQKDFTVREGGRRVNTVVMRFDGGCLDEKGWE